MKKIVSVMLAAALIAALCGCASSKPADESESDDGSDSISDYYSGMEKAQQISVSAAGSGEIIKNVSGKKDIEDFITALEIEDWKLGELPENAEKSGEFSFSQEKTLKAGEKETDGDLYSIMKMYSYGDQPYVRLEVAKMGFTFKIPDTAAAYLDGLLKQA